MVLVVTRSVRALCAVGLTVAMVGAWSLSDVSTAQAFTVPSFLDPISLPSDAGSLITDGVGDAAQTLEGISLDEAGTDSLIACGSAGVETLGAACIAAGAISLGIVGGTIYEHLQADGSSGGSSPDSPPDVCSSQTCVLAFDTDWQAWGITSETDLAGNQVSMTYASNSAGTGSPTTTWLLLTDANGVCAYGTPTNTGGDTQTFNSFTGISQYPAIAHEVGDSVSTLDCGDQSSGSAQTTEYPTGIEAWYQDPNTNQWLNPGTGDWGVGSQPSTGKTTKPDAKCSDGSEAAVTDDGADASSDETYAVQCPAGTSLESQTFNSPTTVAGTTTSGWQAPTTWGAGSPYVDCEPGGSDLPCALVWEVENPNLPVTGDADPWVELDNGGDPSLLPSTDTDAQTQQVGGGTKLLSVTGTDTDQSSATAGQSVTLDYRCAWGPYVVPFAQCYAGNANQTVPTGQPAPVAASDTDACFPSGWGLLNPIQWVEKPVECAFTWAFIPPPGSITGSVDDLETDAQTKPPMSLAVGASAGLSSVYSAYSTGGCSEFPDFSPAQNGEGRLPCVPSTSPEWSVARDLMSGALAVGTVLAAWAMLTAAIGGRTPMGGDDD